MSPYFSKTFHHIAFKRGIGVYKIYIYLSDLGSNKQVFKYKYKYFLKYLNTNTNTYFSMYLNTNTNTFEKYLNTNTNTLYKLNMIKQCMLIWE